MHRRNNSIICQLDCQWPRHRYAQDSMDAHVCDLTPVVAVALHIAYDAFALASQHFRRWLALTGLGVEYRVLNADFLAERYDGLVLVITSMAHRLDALHAARNKAGAPDFLFR